MLAKLSSHDANVVVLELEIRGLRRLAFDSPDIAEADNKLLIEARDKRIELLQQNLIHAKKVSDGVKLCTQGQMTVKRLRLTLAWVDSIAIRSYCHAVRILNCDGTGRPVRLFLQSFGPLVF